MEYNDIIGCIGVTLILFAYFLNTCKYIKQGKLFYVMNIFGAGLACYASVLINYRPFIILEGTLCGIRVRINENNENKNVLIKHPAYAYCS